jgi:hypothetical protein
LHSNAEAVIIRTFPRKMPVTDFFVNTAMICYNCRRTAIVRLKQSYREVACFDQEVEVLDVVFVSCIVCLSILSNVYNPATADIVKHVNLGDYSSELRSLVYIFGCTPSILQEKKLSILKIRQMPIVRDTREIFHVVDVPQANIMILFNGEEVGKDSRFFMHEPLIMDREILRCFPSPFSSFIERIPLYKPTNTFLHHLIVPPPPYDDSMRT